MTDPADGAAPYGRLVLPQVRRALALLDGDPASPTWGCFDRPFWHYRTLVDFPGATWQQLVWPLALIHRLERPDNPLAGDRRLLDAVGAGLRWWTRIQHRDGSFDEWYRNERSYCPTAFTTAAACEALLILGEMLPPDVRQATLAGAERAGAWLERRFNREVMNQNLAAALALSGIAALTGAGRWRQAAERTLRRVAEAQHAEGWLPEYGGADFGYGTLALDLLAALDARGGAIVRPMAERLSRLLFQAQGAGPGYPGRLGSRGTAHVFPYGAEHFAASIPEAAALAGRWRRDHATGALRAPADIDERYFAYFYLPQFAQAWAAASPALSVPDLTLPAMTRLPGAGLVIVRRAGWSASVSTALGGALAVQRPGEEPGYLLGYEIGTADGRSLVSHHRQPRPAASPEISQQGDAVTVGVGVRFARRRRSLPLVRWALPFRAFTLLLGIGRAAEVFQALVKRRMIAPRAAASAALTRTMTIGPDSVAVRDEIRLLGRGPRITSVLPSAQIAVHSPSARQDPGTDIPVALDPGTAEALARSGRLVLEHRWPAPLR